MAPNNKERVVQAEAPEPITKDEAWRITCHEAGHAFMAVYGEILFTHVERDGLYYGLVNAVAGPLEFAPNGERRGGTPDEISRWQRYYAGGAAAEQLLFGELRGKNADGTDPYGFDKGRHRQCEELLGNNRCDGWEQDIQSAKQSLAENRDSLMKIATALHGKLTIGSDRRERLTDDEVYNLLGRKPSWDA